LQKGTWEVEVDGLGYPSEWHILGWRMRDESTPLGPYDQVDPALVDVDALRIANTPPYIPATSHPMG